MKITKVVMAACIALALVWLFVGLHGYANTLRARDGVGGEIAVFFLPIIVWAVYRNIKDMRGAQHD